MSFEPAGDHLYRTVRMLRVHATSLPGVRHTVVIPAGFEFDGATIPKAAWAIIGSPFQPDFMVAACVHDWYCVHSLQMRCYQSRVIGDAVFFKLLADAGVPRWKRTLMYAAVRANTIVRYRRSLT